MNDPFGFANAICNNREQQTIRVTFANGTSADYSRSMYSLMITDPAIIEIMDNETGEIIHYK